MNRLGFHFARILNCLPDTERPFFFTGLDFFHLHLHTHHHVFLHSRRRWGFYTDKVYLFLSSFLIVLLSLRLSVLLFAFSRSLLLAFLDTSHMDWTGRCQMTFFFLYHIGSWMLCGARCSARKTHRSQMLSRNYNSSYKKVICTEQLNPRIWICIRFYFTGLARTSFLLSILSSRTMDLSTRQPPGFLLYTHYMDWHRRGTSLRHHYWNTGQDDAVVVPCSRSTGTWQLRPFMTTLGFYFYSDQTQLAPKDNEPMDTGRNGVDHIRGRHRRFGCWSKKCFGMFTQSVSWTYGTMDIHYNGHNEYSKDTQWTLEHGHTWTRIVLILLDSTLDFVSLALAPFVSLYFSTLPWHHTTELFLLFVLLFISTPSLDGRIGLFFYFFFFYSLSHSPLYLLSALPKRLQYGSTWHIYGLACNCTSAHAHCTLHNLQQNPEQEIKNQRQETNRTNIGHGNWIGYRHIHNEKQNRPLDLERIARSAVKLSWSSW